MGGSPLLLRRFIAVTIVLSLFGLTTAWAFEMHGVDAGVHEAHAGFPGSPPDHDGYGCDHSCHAGAHLIALGQAPKTFTRPAQPTWQASAPADSFASRSIAPPLKPPQS
jgi:hypothetical protein